MHSILIKSFPLQSKKIKFYCEGKASFPTNDLKNKNNKSTISFLGHNILHLDYYIDDRNKNNIWIYWVDFEEGKNNGIYRSHPDGSEKQHIIKVKVKSAGRVL